ncbi:MAG: hypothetical protein RIQ88_173 [Actinomycetota bacterium]|jgi:tRNA(Ile)-lysidine synthase
MSVRPRLSPAMADVRRAIRTAWQQHGITEGSKVVVACSGGADSLALASATIFEAKRKNIRIFVLIINHNLQLNSRKVAESAAKIVSHLEPDAVEIVDVQVSKNKLGMEAAAREARYKALDKYALKMKAKIIMLGHTLDDQAETVLLGLTRGSGSKSIAGMSVLSADKKYLRPLLNVRRETTVAYCNDLGLKFWKDPQNQDTKFTRVKVRRTVLPLLEKELGPGIAEALSRTAELLQADLEFIEREVEKAFRATAKVLATSVILDAVGLAKLPLALSSRVVIKALNLLNVQPSKKAVDSVLELVTNWHGQKPLTLPGARVFRQGTEITLKSTKTLKPGAC